MKKSRFVVISTFIVITAYTIIECTEQFEHIPKGVRMPGPLPRPITASTMGDELRLAVKQDAQNYLIVELDRLSGAELKEFNSNTPFFKGYLHGCECGAATSKHKLVKTIDLKINGQKVVFPEDSFADLVDFHIHTLDFFRLEKQSEVFFLEFGTGDGAAGTFGRFVIRDGRVIRREIQGVQDLLAYIDHYYLIDSLEYSLF